MIKAYRKCALKYHPDKNADCDSSCIFTTVQSAYERLHASAPNDREIPVHDAVNGGYDASRYASSFVKNHTVSAENRGSFTSNGTGSSPNMDGGATADSYEFIAGRDRKHVIRIPLSNNSSSLHTLSLTRITEVM